jgi:hypothetical protein
MFFECTLLAVKTMARKSVSTQALEVPKDVQVLLKQWAQDNLYQPLAKA